MNLDDAANALVAALVAYGESLDEAEVPYPWADVVRRDGTPWAPFLGRDASSETEWRAVLTDGDRSVTLDVMDAVRAHRADSPTVRRRHRALRRRVAAASVGVVRPAPGETAESALRRADEEMYERKRARR